MLRESGASRSRKRLLLIDRSVLAGSSALADDDTESQTTTPERVIGPADGHAGHGPA
jgi:hypothetical protein